jgi:hypothetical protein
MQRAIIVRGYWSGAEWNDTTDELNKYLSDGWEVVTTSPMGAFGYSGNGNDYNSHMHADDNGFASLVIIKKD